MAEEPEVLVGIGWAEAQLVVAVLLLLFAGIALLSCLVIAPECEKHWRRQSQRRTSCHSSSEPIIQRRHSKNSGIGYRHTKSFRALDDSSLSDDDAELPRRTSRLFQGGRHHYSSDSDTDTSTHGSSKTELFRRRVLLRTLGKEIDGAIQETAGTNLKPNNKSQSAETPLPTSAWPDPSCFAPMPMTSNPPRTDRRTGTFDPQLVTTIQAHPVECRDELVVLAASESTPMEQLLPALRMLHDVLAFYLSVAHRDMNKVTVYCNSLLQHDGLNHLRGLQRAEHPEIRALATQIVETAVPLIWH